MHKTKRKVPNKTTCRFRTYYNYTVAHLINCNNFIFNTYP